MARARTGCVFHPCLNRQPQNEAAEHLAWWGGGGGGGGFKEVQLWHECGQKQPSGGCDGVSTSTSGAAKALIEGLSSLGQRQLLKHPAQAPIPMIMPHACE